VGNREVSQEQILFATGVDKTQTRTLSTSGTPCHLLQRRTIFILIYLSMMILIFFRKLNYIS